MTIPRATVGIRTDPAAAIAAGPAQEAPSPEAEAQEALRRADTKAATLLQLVGLALAGVMALVSTSPTGAAAVLLWLALAPILASVVLLLVTILPRLGRHPVPGTWLHAATVTASALPDTSTDAARVNADTHLCRVARMARRKYRYVQAAVALLITGLVLLIPALALIA